MKTNSQAAKQVKIKKAAILWKIKKLEAAIKKYGDGEELNYAHLGSLGYVDAELTEITLFLGLAEVQK